MTVLSGSYGLPTPGAVGPQILWSTSVVNTSSTTLYTVPGSAYETLITFMSLINSAGASGVTAAIAINGVYVHSGAIGAGQLDRFPLNCYVIAGPSQSVVLDIFGTSTWHTVGYGWRLPAYTIL